MLLYQQFKKVLEELGDLKLAWFTSFNMDIYFIEKYLLSAINHMPPEDFRTLRDYEVLNECLHQREEADQKIDIKFFYDFRADNSSDSKKTCVSIVPVNPKNLTSKDEKQFNGVFHPKISLLVNNKNEAYILATSANLSLSAWARNSECAIFKKIEDRTNAHKVVQFFKTISNVADHPILKELDTQWQKLDKERSDWDFLSSCEQGGLLDKIESAKDELTVWSPYFSDDLPQIIDNHLNGSTIELVPDAIEGVKVRISNEVMEKIHSMEKVILKKDQFDFKEAVKPFVHAKTWLTKDAIAIGSWNFTNAGLNLTKTNCNVEAGIIQKLDADSYNALKQTIHLGSFEEPEGTDKEELQSERQSLLNNYTLSCCIVADWDTFKYSVHSLTVVNTDKHSVHGLPDDIDKGKYTINLPGIGDINLDDLCKGEISFKEQQTSILKERIFTIYKEQEIVFCGLISEQNTDKRPAFGYENINDLLGAWLNEKADGENGKQVHRCPDESETGEELNEQQLSQMSSDYAQGWFSMFIAMNNIKQKFIDIGKDKKALKLYAYQMPGCLFQLHEQVLELTKTEEKERTVSKPFLWFVINEVNAIIEVFNNLMDDNELHFTPIKNDDNLELGETMKEVDSQKAEDWLNKIKKECYEQ